MGSFSWCRAEATTQRSNITCGDKYKILVPQEFGGGYIQDIYDDYGRVFPTYARGKDNSYLKYVDGDGNVYPASEFVDADIDLYGILAWWNAPKKLDFIIPDNVPDDDPEEAERSRPKTMYDIMLRGCCEDNRGIGIDIGCYEEQVDHLKYPLKLVSASYRGAYEQCKGRSYDDPEQGFFAAYWKDEEYRKIKKRVVNGTRRPAITAILRNMAVWAERHL